MKYDLLCNLCIRFDDQLTCQPNLLWKSGTSGRRPVVTSVLISLKPLVEMKLLMQNLVLGDR